MIKDFDIWNKLKTKLDSKPTPPSFKEKEIWWCSLGINIGHEENGKNQLFNRPVLVIRKFNKHIFLGIPLTTKIKYNKFYFNFVFKGNNQCAMLSQIRV
ncbi:MAG TPA: type II toxin-antitoxin system PemK/MazF family toxin [Rickettsiales bacterium]|nr:type II toxin-antitoxin system PemK/MazF family toxin [Rickettsiales bacterium]